MMKDNAILYWFSKRLAIILSGQYGIVLLCLFGRGCCFVLVPIDYVPKNLRFHSQNTDSSGFREYQFVSRLFWNERQLAGRDQLTNKLKRRTTATATATPNKNIFFTTTKGQFFIPAAAYDDNCRCRRQQQKDNQHTTATQGTSNNHGWLLTYTILNSRSTIATS